MCLQESVLKGDARWKLESATEYDLFPGSNCNFY